MVFGIQRDEDARMLEILFGIPDYRYNVFLVRLVLIFLLVFVLLILFAALGSCLLYPIEPVKLAAQLLFPVCFLGSLAFLFATKIKNGNATAVVMVLFGFFLTIFSEIVEDTLWDIFLNPFGNPRQYTQLAFQQIIWKNSVFKYWNGGVSLGCYIEFAESGEVYIVKECCINRLRILGRLFWF